MCKARPDDPFIPSESEQRELCNCGYARGRCARLPDDSADAVRFSLAVESEAVIQLVWVIERAHAPAEFGTLAYLDGKITAPSCAAAPLLAEQAAAFVESILNNNAGASPTHSTVDR